MNTYTNVRVYTVRDFSAIMKNLKGSPDADGGFRNADPMFVPLMFADAVAPIRSGGHIAEAVVRHKLCAEEAASVDRAAAELGLAQVDWPQLEPAKDLDSKFWF
jgi:hypothetical protein